MFKFCATAISFGRLFHLSIIRIKKEFLIPFEAADANLSLKRWLDLKGGKSCANVKDTEGSSPLSLFIVL